VVGVNNVVDNVQVIPYDLQFSFGQNLWVVFCLWWYRW